MLHLEADYKKLWFYKEMVGSAGTSSVVALSDCRVLENMGWSCECTNIKNIGSAAVVL